MRDFTVVGSKTAAALVYVAVFSYFIIFTYTAAVRADGLHGPEWIRNTAAAADSLLRTGQIEKARSLADLAVTAAGDELAANDTLLAYVLNILGKADYFMADYANCKLNWQKSYEIRKAVYGEVNEQVAASMNNLGALAKAIGDFPTAESLYLEVLVIRKKLGGGIDQDYATGLNNLASLYRMQGKFAEAEPLYHEALRIYETDLGPEHPLVAGCLNNLGVLYDEQGRYAEAEKYYLQALEIREKTLGLKHPQTAAGLNNLAGVYVNLKRYPEAESLYREALTIREEIYGPDHPALTSSLNNLALLYMEYNDYQKAEPLLLRALAIKEKSLPPGHPLIASTYDNLATLYYDEGIYDKAIDYHTRALDIYLAAYGENHPYTCDCRANLALVYAAIGDYKESLDQYIKLQRAQRAFIDDVFSYASEEQKIKYIRKYPLIDDKLISLAVATKSEKAKLAALEMVLRNKAAVIDAVCAEKKYAYLSKSDAAQAQLQLWTATCGYLSNLILTGADNLQSDGYLHTIDSLYSVKDSLETLLSRESAEFKSNLAIRKFTLDQVVGQLPEDVVLWEFVQYRPYDFTGYGSIKQRTGESRYIAFTLDSSGRTTLIELGSAAAIDSLIDQARRTIYNAPAEIIALGEDRAEKRFNEISSKLYDRLMAPLVSALQTQIFISPDGQLNLLPFDILAGPDGRYAVENYAISYVSSGRDLLTAKALQAPDRDIVVMVNPRFDCPETKSKKTNESIPETSDVDLTTMQRGSKSPDCISDNFTPLPYTEAEGEFIRDLFTGEDSYRVRYYDGGSATEKALKNITPAPLVLHLATHGFFCPATSIGNQTLLTNPLLRSGIALAGANCATIAEDTNYNGTGEDGILTAFEASGLNLQGLELVTLSACETGTGEVQAGEGVFGLRRAFQYAGARAILMSLWNVPEMQTRQLMENFYVNWLAGYSKEQSLRRAELQLLQSRRLKGKASHPYYWGAFLLFGNPM